MADEIVTDEDLDKAADALTEETDDGVQEEEKVEVKEEEGKEKEIDFEDLIKKEIHETKSDWGRKQASLEKQVGELSGMVESLVNVIESTQKKDEQPEDYYLPGSQEEFDARVRQVYAKDRNIESSVAEKDRLAYEKGYLDTVSHLTSGLNQNAVTVIENMIARENGELCVKYSADPIADAERNFLKAKIVLMERSVEKKKNPLGGGTTKNLGGSSSSGGDFKSTRNFELDEHASAFAKYHNLDEESD